MWSGRLCTAGATLLNGNGSESARRPGAPALFGSVVAVILALALFGGAGGVVTDVILKLLTGG